jgi:ribonuclease HII
MPEPAYRIGVDENGLGPRLGPLVVTAVMARVVGEGREVAQRKPRGALAKRLGDSKALVAHGDVTLGEAWARALVERGCGRPGSSAASPEALVDALAADGRDVLRAPCPGHVAPQCWCADGESFTADPALVQAVRGDVAALAAKGVEVVAVRSVLVCSQRLNAALARGLSRFDMDLHAMERLVLELAALSGGEVAAVCGKVGGFDRYSDAFGPLAGRLHAILEEGRARSAYRFPGLGEIAFVRDGDASDPMVGMASLVGKYLRDLAMARIVRFYRREAPELPNASGYSDPVTAGFIDATRLARQKSAVPDDCFERRALG